MDFHFEGEVPPLSRESSLALFRIVQEAISNAALHSGADTVRVVFSQEEANVVAEVIDDGQGFDPEETLARAARSPMLAAIKNFFAAAPPIERLPDDEVDKLYPWRRWSILESTFLGVMLWVIGPISAPTSAMSTGSV